MISQPIFFALLSLFLAGINDVVFKRFSRKDRSRGMLVFGVGLVWTTLQWLDIAYTGHGYVASSNAWLYGTLAGLCVAVANIALLEGLRHTDVSLGSTIYRLNTIVVVLLSVAFLGETLSLAKASGITLGVLAVLLLYHPAENGDPRAETLRLGLFVIITASFMRALYGVTSKAALSEGVDSNTLILFSSVCWVAAGLAYAVIVEKRFVVTTKKAIYALVSGCLVYGIVKSLITALQMGEASVVVPIANMSFVIALVVAMMFRMERLTRKKLSAIALAMGAIMLLSRV